MFLQNTINKILPFIICGFAGLFLVYEFTLQVSPSVMTQGLMSSFHIDALTLGSTMAMYYYAYTPMQLFSGLSFDHFGARKTLTVAIFACAIGTLFLASSHNIYFAGLGRFLTGLGSSCAFVGVLFLGERWFHPRHFYLVAGITELLGCLGAIGGQIPISHAVEHFGWRNTLYCLAIFGFTLAIFVWLIIREKISKTEHHCLPEQLKVSEGLKHVLKNSQSWAVGLYAFCVFAPITTFAALWGVPFLVAKYAISTPLAGSMCAMIWLGMGIGSPIAGWISEKLFSRRKPLGFCAILGILVIGISVYIPNVPISWMFVLLFLFGVATSGQSLSFNVINDNMPSKVIGTAMGFNNMLIVMSGAIFQPIVGSILSHLWNGQMLHGAPVYTLENYQYAFILLPIFYFSGYLINKFWIKETLSNGKLNDETRSQINASRLSAH